MNTPIDKLQRTTRQPKSNAFVEKHLIKTKDLTIKKLK